MPYGHGEHPVEDLAQHRRAETKRGPVLDDAVEGARPAITQPALTDDRHDLVVDRAAVGLEGVRRHPLRFLLEQPEGCELGHRG